MSLKYRRLLKCNAYVFITCIMMNICTIVLFVKSYKRGTTEELSVIEKTDKHNLLTVSARNNTTRLYCIIMTAYKYFTTRAKAVNETWAPKCDTYSFMSESLLNRQVSYGLPLLQTSNVLSGYDHLTSKSVTAFLHVYENSFLNHDWFIKADDDTFIIVEHLRDFLRLKDPSEPVTYGYNFKLKVENGYHSGGAAYVLSKEALKRLYFAYKSPHNQCKEDGGDEDVEIARCLRTVDVYPGESLDSVGKEMFHPEPFVRHFEGVQWLSEYAMNPPQAHFNCCSDKSISFHHITPVQMYFMEYLLYRASPGKVANNQKLISKNTNSL